MVAKVIISSIQIVNYLTVTLADQGRGGRGEAKARAFKTKA